MYRDHDIKLAAAQLKFCEDKNVPLFAPSNGSCFHCCRSICEPRELSHGTRLRLRLRVSRIQFKRRTQA